MSLQDFLKQRQAAPVSSAPAGGGSLSEFLKKRQAAPKVPTQATPQFGMVTESLGSAGTPTSSNSTAMTTFSEKPGPLRMLTKQLMKPVGIVATGAEQTGLAINQGSLKPLAQVPKKSLDIVTGKAERSFSDIYREYLPNNPTAATIIGTATDIVSDPLNFLGGGLTKAGRLAEKATSLSKAGEAIAEGSKLAGQVEKAGLTAEQLKLGTTKAEQAAKGQRAFLQFADRPLLPQKASEAIYNVTGKVADKLGSTKLVQTVKPLVSNATSNKEFDAMLQHYRDLGDYRRAEVLDEARSVQAEVAKLNRDEVIQVSNYLENPAARGSLPLSVQKIGERLRKTYDDYKALEKELGVAGGEVANYAPHIKAKDSLGRTLKDWLKPKTWSANLGGAAKHRRIAKLTGESGESFIAKLDDFDARRTTLSDIMQKTTGPLRKRAQRLQKKSDALYDELRLKSARGAEITPATFLSKRGGQKAVDETTFSEAQLMAGHRLDVEVETLLREAQRREGYLMDRRIPQGNGQLLVKDGDFYRVSPATIQEVNADFGRKFFEENPAIQMANRGLGHAKAVTGKEFLEGVKQFAVRDGVEVAAPELRGLKFEPDVARHIDAYHQAIKPDELRLVMRTFDGVQNWWKGQALIAPSYHIRNFVSNLWNNFLAGVKSPIRYIQAGNVQSGIAFRLVDDAGRTWTEKTIADAAKRTGVVNQGWYAADIPQEIGAEVSRTWKQGINPLSKQNYAFRLNREVGSYIENNARIALFIDQLKQGYSIDHAAMNVKKYLFDYNDLTTFEKTVLKRVMPFYTWTRKNIPLQLENLVRQPGKAAGLEKAVRAVESISMGDAAPANEKYLSDYIRGNTAMRTGYDPKSKTYYYFLLGNWVPSYQAIDFLAQPVENIMGMLTPFFKTPLETMVNKSTFFKNTLGEYENIERYPGETTNYLGFSMPKKTAGVLRSIRLLNELDKLNPGLIFGGKKGRESVWSKLGLPAVKVPLLGTVSPAPFKYSATTPQPSGTARTAGLLAGKLQGYNVSQSRDFYNRDTEDRVAEMEQAIKKAAKSGDRERVKLLKENLLRFRKERGR